MTTTSASDSTSSPIKALNIWNVLAYIANIGLVMGVPSLFKLPDNAELSAKYQTLITPAGWAFAIWGLIFTTQAVWAIIQLAIPEYRTAPQVTKGVAYNYILVCAFQVAWTFAFALEQMTMSMMWMLGILVGLYRIYMAQETLVLAASNSNNRSTGDYWLLRFPFGLHFGWIIAATLVNANLVIVAYKASASLQFGAALATLGIATVVALGVLIYEAKCKLPKKLHPNVVIPLVLVWALNAISKELHNPKPLIATTFTSTQIMAVKELSGIAAVAILLPALVLATSNWWKNETTTSAEEEDGPESTALLSQQ